MSFTNWFSRLAALAATITVLPAIAACPVPTVDNTLSADYGQSRHLYPATPGKAIGLLGQFAEAMKEEGRYSSDPTTMAWGVNGTNYRWVYVVNPSLGGTDFNIIPIGTIPVGQPGYQERKYYNLETATPISLARWNVKSDYALVEAEVNDGDGSPQGADSFVATKVTQLDGTPSYPLDVAKTIRDLGDCADSYIRGSEAALLTQMEVARQAALGDKQPTGPQSQSQIQSPTWNAASETLELPVRYQRGNGQFSCGCGIEPPGGGHHCCALWGPAYGVKMSVVYRVDKTGKLVSAQASPIATYKRFIPPPPVAGPIHR